MKGDEVSVLETRGLKKSFRTRRGVVEAVRGVGLSVEKGEIFGFLGPNGAGKTTTLRMLATLLEPDGGEATVAGCDLLKEPGKVRERIGYVGQAGGADRSATGRENLMLQARLYGMRKKEAREKVEKMIPAFDLDSFADRMAKTYSGGQRRRLDLALGMVHQPEILFLDEPTTGLDPQSRARLWDEVRRLRESGTTVFITTHYMDEADALCERLAIIDDGEIVSEDTPDGLKRQISGDIVNLGLEDEAGADKARNSLEGQTFIRDDIEEEAHSSLRLYAGNGDEALPAILRLLDSKGIPVRSISLSRPTLDDVFLKKTGRSLREDEKETKTEEVPS